MSLSYPSPAYEDHPAVAEKPAAPLSMMGFVSGGGG